MTLFVISVVVNRICSGGYMNKFNVEIDVKMFEYFVSTSSNPQ